MLKVMSFNLRYGLANDGENRWERRREFALARIQAFGPDLLGLQECRDDAQAVFVRANLPDYQFLAIHRGGDDDTTLEMAPALIRHGSGRLVQHGYFWLSETPAVAGSKSWDSVFARTVTWAQVIHTPTGRPLTFVNTHFDYQPGAIAGAAQVLLNWLRTSRPEAPVIVTGDFNADKHSAAYQLLTEDAGLADAYRLAHPGDAADATFHGFGQSPTLLPIDWILISDHFRVVDAAVDRSRAGNLFPSDHYPITAVLEWKD